MILESKLIEQCIQGNNIAQKQIYDHYSGVLYAISLRYARDAEEAQDILQDSFVKIFTKLHTFQFQGSFEGWVKRITTNTAIEYYRKQINHSHLDDMVLSINISTTENKNLEVEEVLNLIQSMPDGYRMVFNLYAIEGYSHAEIAEKLNISEGTSKSQLSRARIYLQKKMEIQNKISIQSIQPLLIFLRLLF